MPKKAASNEVKKPRYKPFTKEEREEVLRKHDDFVYKYNTYLQLHGEKELDTVKLRKEVEAKLDDSKEAVKYRITQQIAEKAKKQEEIAKKLVAKYPLAEGQTDYLSRSLTFMLRTDGTKESQKYNDDLYKEYQKDPRAFAYSRMRNILNFDATELLELEGDEVKMLEWLRDNPALAHEANEFGNPIDPSGAEGKAFGTSNLIKNNLASMRGTFQKINYIGSVIKSKYEHPDHLAVPGGLGKDRAYDMMFNTSKYMEKGYKLSPGMRYSLQEQADFYKRSYSVNDIANKLKTIGINPGRDMLLKYYAVKSDPKTGKQEQVPIDEFIEDKPNVSILERSKGDIERLKYLTKDFELKYNFEFQKRMGIGLGMGDKGYNIFKVLKDHKSGFFSRDSKEYKEFAQALADFTNPEKQGHVDKEGLRKKIDAYLQHTEQVKPGKNTTDPVRMARIELANLARNTLNHMDREGIQQQIGNEIMNGADKFSQAPKEQVFDDSFVSFFDEDLPEKEDNLIDISVNHEFKEEVNIDEKYTDKYL